MEQINRIELRGLVGFVRLNQFNSQKVLHMSVATNYIYRNKEGAPEIETTWHNVTVWQSRDMPDLSLVEKGSKVQLIGRLRSQKYTDSDGMERTSYEVIAYKLELIDDPSPMQFQA